MYKYAPLSQVRYYRRTLLSVFQNRGRESGRGLPNASHRYTPLSRRASEGADGFHKQTTRRLRYHGPQTKGVLWERYRAKLSYDTSRLGGSNGGSGKSLGFESLPAPICSTVCTDVAHAFSVVVLRGEMLPLVRASRQAWWTQASLKESFGMGVHCETGKIALSTPEACGPCVNSEPNAQAIKRDARTPGTIISGEIQNVLSRTICRRLVSLGRHPESRLGYTA